MAEANRETAAGDANKEEESGLLDDSRLLIEAFEIATFPIPHSFCGKIRYTPFFEGV